VRAAESLTGPFYTDAKPVLQWPVMHTGTQAGQIDAQHLRRKSFREFSAELAIQAIEIRTDMASGRCTFFILAAQPERRAVIVRLGHAFRT